MPTILRENGYRFYWYSNEGVYKRIHIHVERAGSKAKFWLHPLELAENKDLSSGSSMKSNKSSATIRS